MSVHFPVCFPIPYSVSRCPSFPLPFRSRVLLMVSLAFPFFAPVGGGHLAAIFVSLSLHFPPKTSTTPKFLSLPSSFPSRPFVFRLYITCSSKSGGISQFFRFSFPCPVNELSRSEWEAFPRCFSTF